MPQLIDTIDDARANIVNYDQALQALRQFPGGVQASLLNTVSHAQVWVATNHNGAWLVGPAKWVGYKDITPQLYHAHRRAMSGSKASGRLAELELNLEPVPRTHPARVILMRLASSVGKAARDGCEIYLLPGEELPAKDRMAIDGLAQLVERAQLSDEALAYLGTRIEQLIS